MQQKDQTENTDFIQTKIEISYKEKDIRNVGFKQRKTETFILYKERQTCLFYTKKDRF